MARSLLLGLLLPGWVSAQPVIQHDLRVLLQPEQHVLQVTDSITLPNRMSSMPTTVWHFALHAGLAPVSLTPGVQLVRQPDAAPGTSEEPHKPTPPPLERYAVRLPAGTRTFTLRYQGHVHHPLPPQRPEDPWNFYDSAGMLAAEGVSLSAATYWYPRFGDELLTFRLDVQLPPAWDAVSQGQRTRHARDTHGTYVRWETPPVQEDMYLVGGMFTEYSAPADTVPA